jgi:tetratricopeptide (TPR) repeat protein
MASVVRARAALIAAVVAVEAGLWLGPRLESARAGPTDFDLELQALDRDIGVAEHISDDQRDVRETTRLAYLLYQRGSLTERADDFQRVRRLLEKARHEAGPLPELRLLQATLDLRVHQLEAARHAIDEFPDLAENMDAEMIAADIDLQRGAYDSAQRGYERTAGQHPSWTSLARLAFLTARRGDVAAADGFYTRAEDELTAKEMRHYAWLELQRGQLQFSRGRYAEARKHYDVAERAYSGYWLTDEYRAELLGAERRFNEAIALYDRAIARAPRPDLLQQLGDLYLFMGRPADAQRWHAEALDGYLASVARGDVQFLHHLAGFYADVVDNPAEAVNRARQDAALRPGYAADDTLAWALYRNGNVAGAMIASDRALASKMVDAHVYYHAAQINAAAGDAEAARKWTAALHALNPNYSDFHVHR